MPLISKQQAIVSFKLAFPKRFLGMRGKEMDILRSIRAREKGFPVLVFQNIKLFPIVHSGTPEIFVIYLKTKGMNKM